MKLRNLADGRESEVEIVERGDSKLRAIVNGREICAGLEILTDGGAILAVAGRRRRVFGALRNSILAAVGPRTFEFARADESIRRRSHGLATPTIEAPMPGKVLRVLVRAGDLVAAGQPLIVLEAMKMETTLAAEGAAVVRAVHAAEGDMVDHGAVLIELSPPPDSSATGSSPPAR